MANNARIELKKVLHIPTSPISSLLLKDTLGIAMQNSVIWLVGMLHCNCLGEFSQHPLLEGFKPLVVVSTANKLFILCQE